MDNCHHLADYLASERHRLFQAISENKWYLSEQAGHDVGYLATELHFIDHFLPAFACAFRIEYCQSCQQAMQCGLRRDRDPLNTPQ